MVTLAQRIEALRTERGMSRPALSAALSLPKTAVEKFETGRQSPTKEQVQLLADYFGVSTFYLRGESNDRTRQDAWLDEAYSAPEKGHTPLSAPKRKEPAGLPNAGEGTVFDSFLHSKAFQALVRDTVQEVLRSPEGQRLIAKAVQRELNRRG